MSDTNAASSSDLRQEILGNQKKKKKRKKKSTGPNLQIDMAELDSILGIDERLPFYDTPVPAASVPKPSSSKTKKPKPSTPKKKKVKPSFTPDMKKKLKEDRKAKKEIEKEKSKKARISSKRKSSESSNGPSETEIQPPKKKKLRRIEENIISEREASPIRNETISDIAKISSETNSEAACSSKKQESSKKAEEPNDFWKELLEKQDSESESSSATFARAQKSTPESSPTKKQKGKRRGKSVKQEKLEKERVEKQKKKEEEAKKREEEERQRVMAEIKELLPKVQKKPTFVPDLTVKYPNQELENPQNLAIEPVAEAQDDSSSISESKYEEKSTENNEILDEPTVSNNDTEENQESTIIQDHIISSEDSISEEKNFKSKTIEDNPKTEKDKLNNEANENQSKTQLVPEEPEKPAIIEPVEKTDDTDISPAKEKSATSSPESFHEELNKLPASPKKSGPKKKLTQEEVESLMEKMDSEEEKDKIWRDFLMQDSLDKFEEFEITDEVDNNTQTKLSSEENLVFVSETEEIEQKLANLETEEEKDEAWKEFLMKDAIEANDGKDKLTENDKNNPKDKNDCVSGESSTNENIMEVDQEQTTVTTTVDIDSTSSKPKTSACKNTPETCNDTAAAERNDPTENDKQSTTTPTDAALEIEETDNLPITSLIERMDTNTVSDSLDDNTGIKQTRTVKKQNAHKVDLKKKLTADLEKDGHNVEEVDFSQPQTFAKEPAAENVDEAPAKTAPATRTAKNGTKNGAPPATPAKAKSPSATVPTTPSICVKSDPDRPIPVAQTLTGDEFEVTTEFDVDEFDSEELNEDDPDALELGFSDDLVEENSSKLFMIGIKDIRNLAIKAELEKVGSVGDVMEFQRHKVDLGTFTEEVACLKVASAETAVALVKRFNKRRLLESKNAVVLKQVINFPSKTEMKKIVKATVDDRTKQMIIEAKRRFLDLERDFAREKKSLEDAARALSAAESEISTFRKKHTLHEKNSERAKKETRRLQDEMKKEREVLESIRKSTEIERKACKKISDEVKTTEAELRKVENEIGKIKSRTHQLREIKKQRSRPHAYVAPVEPVSKTVYNDPTLTRSAPLSTRPGDGWQNDGGWIEDDVYASKYANQTSYHSGESELEQIRREREELARKSEQLRQQTYHDDYHVRQMQEEEAALEEERRQIEEMRLENERIQREVAEEKRRQALEEQKYEQERIADERRRQLEQERQAAEQKRRELEELRNRERQKILEEKQRLEEEQRRWAEEKAAAAAARERLQNQRSSLGRKAPPGQFSGQQVAGYQQPPRRQHAGAGDPKAKAWEETRDRMRHEREEAARKRPGIPARGYGPPSARPRNDQDVIVLDDDSPPHRGRGADHPVYSAPAAHGYNNPRRVPSYPPPPVAAPTRRYAPSSIPPPTVPPPTSGRSWPFNRR